MFRHSSRSRPLIDGDRQWSSAVIDDAIQGRDHLTTTEAKARLYLARARHCREPRLLAQLGPARCWRHRRLARFPNRGLTNRPARAEQPKRVAACAAPLRFERGAREPARLWRRASPWRASHCTVRVMRRDGRPSRRSGGERGEELDRLLLRDSRARCGE